MTLLHVIAAALLTGASAMTCPGSSAFFYAKCKLTVTFSNHSCANVTTEVKARIAGTNGWCDPHNKGALSHARGRE